MHIQTIVFFFKWDFKSDVVGENQWINVLKWNEFWKIIKDNFSVRK